ncbi:MAG: cytochrome c biogenesis protein CcdA [Planctomycetota bacterium]
MSIRAPKRHPLVALLVLAAAFLLAPDAAAQDQAARATFFSRVVDGEVHGVLRIRVDEGYHVYHPEVGPGYAVPTDIRVDAPGVKFGDVVFPEPEVVAQPGLGKKGSDTFVWGHHGDVFCLVTGEVEGASPEPASIHVEIVGQTCDDSGCIPYEESIVGSGDGSDDAAVDALFADTDWSAVYDGWPYDLASREKAELAALNGGPEEEPKAPPAKAAAAPSTTSPSTSFGQQGGGFAAFGGREPVLAEVYTRVVGDEVRGIVRVEVDPGYHVYHPVVGPGIASPTVMKVSGPSVDWNDVVFPMPTAQEQKYGSEPATFVWAHEGTFYCFFTGTVEEGMVEPDPWEVEVSIDGQYCDESGCTPWSETIEGEDDGSEEDDVDALFASTDWANLYANWPLDLSAADAEARARFGMPAAGGADDAGAPNETKGLSGTVAPPGPGAPTSDGGGLWQLVVLAVGAGLFALVMPCTYPMIPITISYFTKQADARHGHVWPLAVVYGAGICSMFTAIGLAVYLLEVFADTFGLAAGEAGGAIIAFANSGWFNLVIAVAFFYFALVLFGAINLQPPQWAMRYVGGAQGKGGVMGLFLMGFLLVITSFTCTGPFVGSILATAAKQGGARTVFGMFVFGLTMALPFVVLGMVPGKVKKLPKSGQWMNTVKITLGFVELAAAFKFLSNTDLAWNWNSLPRELFLWIWAASALVIAFYLFGFIKVKGETGEIGPGRMAVAAVFALLSTYFAYGALGNQLGGVMTALAPPYSARVVNQPKIDEMQKQIDALFRAVQEGGVAGIGKGIKIRETGPIVVEDDLELAAARARETGRALFVNFTGHL